MYCFLTFLETGTCRLKHLHRASLSLQTSFRWLLALPQPMLRSTLSRLRRWPKHIILTFGDKDDDWTFVQVVQTFSRSLSCNLECDDMTDLQVHLIHISSIIFNMFRTIPRRRLNAKRSIAKSLRRRTIMTTTGDSEAQICSTFLSDI